jgi:hypothetical protein
MSCQYSAPDYAWQCIKIGLRLGELRLVCLGGAENSDDSVIAAEMNRSQCRQVAELRNSLDLIETWRPRSVFKICTQR